MNPPADSTAPLDSGSDPLRGSEPTQQAKAALRSEVRARLRSLPPETRASLVRRIEAHVWSIPEVIGARSVLLFASLPSEVPTDDIAAEARRRGIQVVYPRCIQDGLLALHTVSGPDQLVLDGRYGIREPAADCPLVTLDEIDVAFVPGLAWDASGARLGRGAGYYDRLFSGFARGEGPLRLGLYFGIQRMNSIPTDPWDAPLDIIVSEDGVLRP
jgi:5-formyltetrahydrofolate cyclo-ligase